MAKKKRRRKRGRKDGKLKKNKKGKEKTRIVFSLEPEDESPKKVVDSVIKKLKEVRGRLKKQHIEELVFARDILTVIGEVVTRYDRMLESGRFTSSPVAQHLYRSLNYMLAAYENIEKMLAEKPFDYLDEYYKTRFTGNSTSVPKKPMVLKHGKAGKQHMPLISKERKKRSKKKDKKIKKNKDKKKRGK